MFCLCASMKPLITNQKRGKSANSLRLLLLPHPPTYAATMKWRGYKKQHSVPVKHRGTDFIKHIQRRTDRDRERPRDKETKTILAFLAPVQLFFIYLPFGFYLLFKHPPSQYHNPPTHSLSHQPPSAVWIKSTSSIFYSYFILGVILVRLCLFMTEVLRAR